MPLLKKSSAPSGEPFNEVYADAKINHSKIESINVIQSILGRILGYGTIIIMGTGSTREPFAAICDPLTFRKKFLEQQG